MIPVNPQKYNLPKTIKLRKDPKGLLIIIDRKSRLIMKDGIKIIGIYPWMSPQDHILIGFLLEDTSPLIHL